MGLFAPHLPQHPRLRSGERRVAEPGRVLSATTPPATSLHPSPRGSLLALLPTGRCLSAIAWRACSYFPLPLGAGKAPGRRHPLGWKTPSQCKGNIAGTSRCLTCPRGGVSAKTGYLPGVVLVAMFERLSALTIFSRRRDSMKASGVCGLASGTSTVYQPELVLPRRP